MRVGKGGNTASFCSRRRSAPMRWSRPVARLLVTLLAAFGLMVASTAAPLASTNGYDRTAKLSTGVVAASSVLRSASLGHPKVATASVVQPRSGPSPRFAAKSALESLAPAAGAKRGAHRVMIDGDPANPTGIYYWDHVNSPVRIGP